ncbi:MAG: flagellar hook-associated protein FlgK [Rhodobacteraceae bacterium]|nr:flagellar hook-associated protein FlgK [Paracoccaceae bacterium]
MSVSASLSNALSGLTAAARAAEVVASNVANARTEGYGRRELMLSSRTVTSSGSGVRIDGVQRHVNDALIADRRIAAASAGGAGLPAAFHSRIEARIGAPDAPGSVGARIAAFEARLVEAASRPDSETRLRAVLDAAGSLAATLGDVSREVQAARMEAEGAIARDVALVNDTLAQVAALNAQIRGLVAGERDPSALMDQRQALVDRIAEVVPLREVARDHGQVALFTPGGAILLDGTAAPLGFARAGAITADMTAGSGGLSGLTLNGQPLSTAGHGPVGGGRLAAAFAVRDRLAPEAQERLDALARDLVERLADPAADPSLAPGAAGLFTDAGAAFDPAAEVGLAGRLRVNALADPARGGAIWRLRDGLGAAAPGPAGDGAGLARLAAALDTPRSPVSGGFLGGAHSLAGLAGEVLSLVAGSRLSAEAEASFTAARAEALAVLEAEGGVDTDQELQLLIMIEKTYAANARVIRTVDEMLSTLLGI